MPEAAPSPHLRSRLEVEEILLAAVPGSTALRASIVIGAGSASFRLLVRLVERLRVLPLPGWHENRTQPVDERDVVEFLARTPQVAAAAGRSLDVAGPDVVSYGTMIERIAELMGVGRMPLGLIALADPAGERGGRRGDRAADGARPSADGEPRDRTCCRATPTRRRGSTGCARIVRPGGRARARRVGVARAARGAMKVERYIDIDAPPSACTT